MFISFRLKPSTSVIKIPQVTDDESSRQGKRSRASRKNSVSRRSATEDDSTSVWDDDDDDTMFGSVDDGDTTTETDWSAAKGPGASRNSTRKTHYSSSVNSRVSSIPTPRSKVSTRQSNPKSTRNSSRAPSENSFVLSRRNSYNDPSGRETRNRSRTSRDGSTVSNRNNSRWSKHSDGGYSISSRRGPSRKAWEESEPSTPANRKTNRGKTSRYNSDNKLKTGNRSRLQSRDSNRSLVNNRKSRPNSEPSPKSDSRKRREPLSRRNSQLHEPTKRKRVPKRKERPALKRADTRGSSISRASTRSRGGRKQAWGGQGRGLGPRANTRPALRRNESFASVSSVASVYSRQQKKMMENIYKMAFDAGVARGKSMSGSERSRSNSTSKSRSNSKSRSRRSSVSSYMSEDDDEDYPSAPGSRRSSRRNSDADSVHLSSVRDSESKFSLDLSSSINTSLHCLFTRCESCFVVARIPCHAVAFLVMPCCYTVCQPNMADNVRSSHGVREADLLECPQNNCLCGHVIVNSLQASTSYIVVQCAVKQIQELYI